MGYTFVVRSLWHGRTQKATIVVAFGATAEDAERS